MNIAQVRRTRTAAVAALLLGVALAAPATAHETSPSGAARPSTGRPPAPPRPPVFAATVSGPLSRRDVPFSWRPGCPVEPSQLRTITMAFWGFDHTVHTGELVVSRQAVRPVLAAFAAAFASRFLIRSMVPVDAYYRAGRATPAGSDTLSMNADNTSAFNCRPKTGRASYSEHSWGTAVDINPYENPSRAGSSIYPAKAAHRFYWNRSLHLRDPGVITSTSALRLAFERRGWSWGGRWSPGHDYQHFSSSGR